MYCNDVQQKRLRNCKLFCSDATWADRKYLHLQSVHSVAKESANLPEFFWSKTASCCNVAFFRKIRNTLENLIDLYIVSYCCDPQTLFFAIITFLVFWLICCLNHMMKISRTVFHDWQKIIPSCKS